MTLPNLQIKINSQKLAHALGVGLSAIVYIYTDPEAAKMLPQYLMPYLHILVVLVPWLASVGISLNTQPSSN